MAVESNPLSDLRELETNCFSILQKHSSGSVKFVTALVQGREERGRAWMNKETLLLTLLSLKVHLNSVDMGIRSCQ